MALLLVLPARKVAVGDFVRTDRLIESKEGIRFEDTFVLAVWHFLVDKWQKCALEKRGNM